MTESEVMTFAGRFAQQPTIGDSNAAAGGFYRTSQRQSREAFGDRLASNSKQARQFLMRKFEGIDGRCICGR
jgi:hypothetical protein